MAVCVGTGKVPGLGFEPRLSDSESLVLPLHYPGIVGPVNTKLRGTLFRVKGVILWRAPGAEKFGLAVVRAANGG